MEQVDIVKAAVLVECPHCFAEPGDGCWDAAGREREPIHMRRRALARSMIEAAASRGVFDAVAD